MPADARVCCRGGPKTDAETRGETASREQAITQPSNVTNLRIHGMTDQETPHSEPESIPIAEHCEAAHPSSIRNSSSTSTSQTASPTDLILGVAVVDFNHLQGPIVEWSHPASLSDNNLHADLTSSLPFCALPDGSHLSDEDFAHFHLHCPTLSKHSTVFGISCNRQIASEKLLVKGKDVTRSTVQKAVVVLARQVRRP